MTTNTHKLHQEIEELTTKLLSIQDLQSEEAKKISKRIKAKIRKALDLDFIHNNFG